MCILDAGACPRCPRRVVRRALGTRCRGGACAALQGLGARGHALDVRQRRVRHVGDRRRRPSRLPLHARPGEVRVRAPGRARREPRRVASAGERPHDRDGAQRRLRPAVESGPRLRVAEQGRPGERPLRRRVRLPAPRRHDVLHALRRPRARGEDRAPVRHRLLRPPHGDPRHGDRRREGLRPVRRRPGPAPRRHHHEHLADAQDRLVVRVLGREPAEPARPAARDRRAQLRRGDQDPLGRAAARRRGPRPAVGLRRVAERPGRRRRRRRRGVLRRRWPREARRGRRRQAHGRRRPVEPGRASPARRCSPSARPCRSRRASRSRCATPTATATPPQIAAARGEVARGGRPVRREPPGWAKLACRRRPSADEAAPGCRASCSGTPTWSARARAYEECAGRHIISQGGYYQYGLNFQGAFRDPLQHVLPIIYAAPALAREVLLYCAAEQPKAGAVPYARPGRTASPSDPLGTSDDLDLWLLLDRRRVRPCHARPRRSSTSTSVGRRRAARRSGSTSSAPSTHQESLRGPHGLYLAGTTGDWSDLLTPVAGMTESTLVAAQARLRVPAARAARRAARRRARSPKRLRDLGAALARGRRAVDAARLVRARLRAARQAVRHRRDLRRAPAVGDPRRRARRARSRARWSQHPPLPDRHRGAAADRRGSASSQSPAPTTPASPRRTTRRSASATTTRSTSAAPGTRSTAG